MTTTTELPLHLATTLKRARICLSVSDGKQKVFDSLAAVAAAALAKCSSVYLLMQ